MLSVKNSLLSAGGVAIQALAKASGQDRIKAMDKTCGHQYEWANTNVRRFSGI
jgi:hypothetical protein